jgi:hypothetical protein
MNQSTHETPENSHDKSWFERNVNLIIVALVIACIGSVVAQATMTMFDDHHPPHFPEYENFLGFQAIFGFVAFITVVAIGSVLRLIIKREEDYYDA